MITCVTLAPLTSCHQKKSCVTYPTSDKLCYIATHRPAVLYRHPQTSCIISAPTDQLCYIATHRPAVFIATIRKVVLYSTSEKLCLIATQRKAVLHFQPQTSCRHHKTSCVTFPGSDNLRYIQTLRKSVLH